MKRKKMTSILSYWTRRYILILVVGMTLITLFAVYWIRETASDNRQKTAGLLGQEIADRVEVGQDGKLSVPYTMNKLLDSRMGYFNFKGEFCLIITDKDGDLVFSRPPIKEEQLHQWLTKDLKSRDPAKKVIGIPIGDEGGRTYGQVSLLLSKRSLAASPNELALACVLLVALILCGWLTIYLLSRKLSLPIRRVAESARRIREGHYDVNLEVDTKEREIDELVVSFKDMASRLKQLEEWRALSLAGVTHELKTPVTSIKGLVMAVRDDVVGPEEAKEFLDIALRESGRLERMVADLLDYNALSAGSVEVRRDRLDLGALVSEIAYQWELTSKNEGAVLSVSTDFPEAPVQAAGDALRIQQIVVNLLNNALQAADPGRPTVIAIRLRAKENRASIEIADNGTGIAAEDRPHIFERFYRGESKKLRTRGLGLGLTYSQLLARAQGGELRLLESSPEGSAFELELPAAPLAQRSERPSA